MNKVVMMGRLTRDPEVRYSQGASQTAIGRFSIAVDRRFKCEGQPDADFFNCTSFGKQAEFVEKYLKKGTKIVISGSLQNDNYTDKDGNKRFAVQILCDEIEFAESKGSGTSNGSSGGTAPSAAGDSGESDGFINLPEGADDEIPFA